MENILKHRSYFEVLYAIVGVALASGAWADAYTDALNSEAAEISVDAQSLNATPDNDKVSASPPETATPNDTPAISGNPISSNLSDITQNQFEDILKVKKRGSFLWYSRLETEQKSQVYQDFLAGTDLETLGKTILKLFTQRK